MAVIQISRIQVRRGLQENLPQLASGEIGWSVDEQRLWIGNGTIAEGAPDIGNTEILTANSDVLSAIESYIFQGRESGYTSKTGITLTSPVNRSLQDKIDEQVSARDFGAVGDGVTDDTAALQRAINELYPLTYYASNGVRRILKVPAGEYIITSELTIPPYAVIIGDGILSTVIRQISAFEDSTVKFRDSKGQIDAALGTLGAENPFQITFEDLTLENETDNHITMIDSSTNIFFNRVRFLGSDTTPTNIGTSKAAARILNNSAPSNYIYFNECRFNNITFGIFTDEEVNNVFANHCQFDTLYRAINLSSTGSVGAQNVKATASTFNNIAKQAINAPSKCSTTSAFNYYGIVGNGDDIALNTGSANCAVLSWGTTNNYSIGDLFERSTTSLVNIIEVAGGLTPTYNNPSTAGTLQSYPGTIETLTNNTTGNTAIELKSTTTNIIDYSIERGTVFRIGTLKVTQNAGTAVYEDDYTETAAIGVTLSVQGYGSNVKVRHNTDNTGTNATFKYSLRTFI